MICPLCGYFQPDTTKECLQCHTPLDAKPTGRRATIAETGEQTQRTQRLERRRRPRIKEKTASRQKEPKEITNTDPVAAFIKRETEGLNQPIEEIVESLRETTPSQADSAMTQIVERLNRVTISTTSVIENRSVLEYKGVVTAGAVVKLEGWSTYLDQLKDAGALRSAPFFNHLQKARDIVMTDLKIEASKLGANGVVGITVQFDQSQQENQVERLVWMAATGTAVVLTD